MSTVVLRRVPGNSAVHRLWAGTKMLAVVAISVLLMFVPSWPVLGVVTVFLLAVALIARVPPTAVPRPPWWFWGLMVLGGLINAPIGTTAVLRYVQIAVFGLVLLGASFVIAWTTALNEIAPAVATLCAPLRKLRLPVDEWAVAIALSLRSLPLLMEEMRVLRAGRRLRPKGGSPHNPRDNGLIDIITAVMSIATRRAGELAEAITARGGTGQLTAYPAGPGRADAVAALIVAASGALAIALHIML
ncbi:energy-coupling factor transporter transmembrane protein EcfT [Aldersonia sp. NBC_00410]|uniref:energy-coupling factor transporter transmembrane component T family protein n=1 Tax=Aldersonia sp. NBC_00410 TaxID=2975954 RepID=UPI00224CA77E|nr:energy-coupling factor transporter transmembrane protein EcfT [Aldersonia sp. NBC_00410]MCX5045646.1 energy-coupling factor transporter transmembrane protein EcfT [Aldersonia sp. NBC_00410]